MYIMGSNGLRETPQEQSNFGTFTLKGNIQQSEASGEDKAVLKLH